MMVLGWIVWSISAAVAFGYVLSIRSEFKNGTQPIHILLVFQGVLMLSSVGAFIFAPWSKLNLIWVMPAAFYGAFLGFGLFPIPMVGTILRVITLGFACLFFVGIQTDDRGIPNGIIFNEMRIRVRRYLKVVWGVVCLSGTICVVTFWPESGALYWLRNVIGGGAAWVGIWNLKVGIFATDDQLKRASSGDAAVFRESALALPSPFSVKDILLVLGVLVVLVVGVVALRWIWLSEN